MRSEAPSGGGRGVAPSGGDRGVALALEACQPPEEHQQDEMLRPKLVLFL